VTAAIADDVSNGRRLFRRAITRPRATWNVVASCGDEQADRTLVVLAHHDAAPTGAIFDERAQAYLAERFPGIIERIDTSLPLWWAMLSAPGLVALGSTLGRRGPIIAGLAGSLLGAAVFADVSRRPVAPGANDNLTAVAVLVALAEHLRSEPIRGLRVLLVSCGAEEVLQGGIHGFAARHFPALDRDRTWVLNLDTVGSPKLILLEGEGPVVMEDYHDRGFRDLVARAAERAGTPLRRGMRSRTSTDAVIPSRAGYPTTTITSMDRYKALSNYHQMSDTPENVDYVTVSQALTLTLAVARELADNPWICR
jgi:Zn-dependent M28 family amino/carboxypeptidase